MHFGYISSYSVAALEASVKAEGLWGEISELQTGNLPYNETKTKVFQKYLHFLFSIRI